jgi:hypothetical protein
LPGARAIRVGPPAPQLYDEASFDEYGDGSAELAPVSVPIGGT